MTIRNWRPAARRGTTLWAASPNPYLIPAHASHTFIALGLWQESIQSNLAANAAAKGWRGCRRNSISMDSSGVRIPAGRPEHAGGRHSGKNSKEVKIERKHTLAVNYAVAAAPARFAIERDAGPRPLRSRRCRAVSCQRVRNSLTRGHWVRHAVEQFPRLRRMFDKLVELRDALRQTKQDYWAKR